jgi:hypothetical protein
MAGRAAADRRRRAAALVLALALATLGAGACGTRGLPDGAAFAVGDQVGGWTVTDRVVHQEFLRLTLRRGERAAGVEVADSRGGTGPWTTTFYRVQPAPGADAPEELLRSVLAALRAAEAAPGHVPLVGARVVSLPLASESPGLTAVLALLHALGLALFAALAAAHLRRHPEDRRAAAAAGGFVLLSAGALAALTWAGGVPVAWLTPLHEGGTRVSVAALYGTYDHGGPVFELWKGLLAGWGPQGLRQVVGLNLLLAAVDAALFLLIARRLLGGAAPALVLTAALVLAPPFGQAALSETPAPLVGLLFLVGAVAAGALDDRAAARPWTDAAALGLLALVGLALFGVRPELGGLAALALPFGVARALGRSARARRWTGRLRPRPPWGAVAVGGLVLAGVALLVVVQLLPKDGYEGAARWVLSGLAPLSRSHLWALPFLVATLPAGLVLLLLAGLVRGLRHPVRTLGLALAFGALFAIYLAAATSPMVVYRYLTLLYLPLGVLAALGGRVVLDGLRRARRWRPAAVGLGAALAVALFAPAVPAAFESPWSLPLAAPAAGALLDTNKQREVRFLAETAAAHPDCLLVTLASHEIRRPDRGNRCDYLLFGGRTPRPYAVERGGRCPQPVAARHAGGHACVLFVRGLDGSLADGPDCRTDACPLPPPLSEQRFASRPYDIPFLHGETSPTVVLGVYPLAGMPPVGDALPAP